MITKDQKDQNDQKLPKFAQNDQFGQKMEKSIERETMLALKNLDFGQIVFWKE